MPYMLFERDLTKSFTLLFCFYACTEMFVKLILLTVAFVVVPKYKSMFYAILV